MKPSYCSISLAALQAIVHFKSTAMKWYAIVTKSQYEKTLQRAEEIARRPAGPQEEDELRLLRFLINDYEKRQLKMQSPHSQNLHFNF